MALTTPDAFARALTADNLYIAGFTGEPTAVIEALVRHPRVATAAHLTTIAIPGVNKADVAAVVPNGVIETFFVSPDLRAAFEARRVRFRPMHYSAIYRDFRQRRDFGIAIVRTSVARAGRVSLGLAHDFLPALLEAGVPVAAMVDPATPFVADGTTIPIDRLTALVDGPSPPIGLPPEPARAELATIAGYAASLVRDGAAVQTGIGAAPNAVLSALTNHRHLTLYGGMLTDAGFDLLDRGVVSCVTTGAAALTGERVGRLESETRIRFRSVEVTHGATHLAAVDGLTAVNSAVEIDLFGQCNGEMIAGRQISGHGGVADYVRGARLSPGGRSIMVLSATGERGRTSRIVPTLKAPVAITRGDVDAVVTEHGIADIRDTDIDTRAARLIAVAAPAFRAGLAEAWDALRRAM